MMTMPFRPALPMNRANLRCLGLSVGIAIALGGCGGPNSAQTQIECRDGVEYLTAPTYGGYLTFAPHLKPDGKPYLCGDALAASAIEAQRAATGNTDAVHESAVPQGDAQ